VQKWQLMALLQHYEVLVAAQQQNSTHALPVCPMHMPAWLAQCEHVFKYSCSMQGRAERILFSTTFLSLSQLCFTINLFPPRPPCLLLAALTALCSTPVTSMVGTTGLLV